MRGSEFAELRAFIEVVELGNFGRAAVELGMAPSTLSQTIKKLEDRLGLRLINRTTRSVALTEAGEHLLSRVRPVFAELDASIESINDFRDRPIGTLRLSVSSIPAQMVLAPLLKHFLPSYPGIQMDISVDNAESDIVKGRFDAGIRYGRRIAQDMVTVRASPPSRIIAVASPEYLSRHPGPKTPEDLQHHACIRFRLGNHMLLPWEFENDGKKIEIGVTGQLIVNDVDLMVKATRDGIGIGYMAETYIAEEISRGELVALLSEWSPSYGSWYLYYPSRQHMSAPLRAFVNFIKAHADQ